MAHVARRHLDPAPALAATPLGPPPPRRHASAAGRRLAHAAAVALAVAAAHLSAADAAAPPAADPDLALLLRAMALTKALVAAAALGLVDWRLRAAPPVRAPVLAGLLAASAALAAGPVLMWHAAHPGAASLAVHGGLLLLVLLALADRRATGEALARAVEANCPRR